MPALAVTCLLLVEHVIGRVGRQVPLVSSTFICTQKGDSSESDAGDICKRYPSCLCQLMLGNGTDDEWAQWAQDKFSPLQSLI